MPSQATWWLTRREGEGFITAVLAELALDTGVLSWVNAGHPEPLLLRDGRLVKTLHTAPALPFGLSLPAPPPPAADTPAMTGTTGRTGTTLPGEPAAGSAEATGERYQVGSEHLRPGDRVVLYTDGITEARSPWGEVFGLRRLVDLLAGTHAARLPAPETLRRVVRALLEHQQNQLTDDATLLLVEWRGDNQDTLLPDPAG